MTATCTLCGAILKCADDVRGPQFTFGDIGATFKKHMHEAHAKEPQTCIPEGELPPNFPILHMVGTMGIVAQTVMILSYLTSDDPEFLKLSEKMRATLAPALAQKEPRPLIAPGQ